MTLILGIALTLALIAILIRRPLQSYFTYRGQRIITCPGNGAPAAVRVDAGHAALWSNVPGARNTLKECSRWPDNADCGQECLGQVEADSDETRVTDIVTKWYEGKSCALCGTPIDHLNWADRRAALVDANGITRKWDAVRPEEILKSFATNQPVCWTCHITENFRRRYPELVTERPNQPT